MEEMHDTRYGTGARAYLASRYTHSTHTTAPFRLRVVVVGDLNSNLLLTVRGWMGSQNGQFLDSPEWSRGCVCGCTACAWRN